MELDSAHADDAIPRGEVDHFCSLLIDGLQVRSDHDPTPAYQLTAPAARSHAVGVLRQTLCRGRSLCSLPGWVLQACLAHGSLSSILGSPGMSRTRDGLQACLAQGSPSSILDSPSLLRGRETASAACR